MGLANALLVRYASGYLWVEDAASIAQWERREGYVTLGQVESPAEATRIATAILADRAQPAVSISAGLEPSGAGDDPYDDFGVGEYVTAPDEDGSPASLRLVSLTVAEDEEGNPTFAPELQTLADVRDQTLQRWLKRMSNGTLGGTVQSASTAPDVGVGPELVDPDKRFAATAKELPPYNFRGTLVAGGPSGRYKAPIALTLVSFACTLVAHISGTVTVDFLLNGVPVHTISITGSLLDFDDPVSIAMGFGDGYQFQCTGAGVGATELVIQPRYA